MGYSIYQHEAQASGLKRAARPLACASCWYCDRLSSVPSGELFYYQFGFSVPLFEKIKTQLHKSESQKKRQEIPAAFRILNCKVQA